MPRRVDFKTFKDFTGGLDLSRNIFQLEPEQTPDCLNVDMDPRGGFGLRRGVERYQGATAGVVHSLLPFTRTDGSSEVLVGYSTNLYRYTAGAWSSVFTGAGTGPFQSVVFKDCLYTFFADRTAVRKMTTAYSVTTLVDPAVGPTYNDNIASPNNGDMPRAKVGASFQSSLFVANINENGTVYPNRVRWSHPLFAEDWMTAHYVDIEPDDGDEITALVPMGDRLLVFKRNSIHAIYGTPPEDVSVSQVSRELGCPSHQAVVSTDAGVLFWHETTGAHRVTADILDNDLGAWIGEPLFPALEDANITAGSSGAVTVGWLNRRFWVSVKWDGSSTKNRVFVYDPFASKKGCWTQYDLAVGPMLAFKAPGYSELSLAAASVNSEVLKVEIPNRYYDTLATVVTHIESYYRTRWFDNGEPAVKKRWKRPEVVLLDGQTADLTVQVYRDYDPTDSVRSFHLTTAVAAADAEWDVDDWDVAYWSGGTDEANVVKRGSPLGGARSVSLKFEGPTTNVNWRVDALTMKWISRRIRN